MRIARFYVYAEIDFGVQKTDTFIINGMVGSVDRNMGHMGYSN